MKDIDNYLISIPEEADAEKKKKIQTDNGSENTGTE